MLNARWYGAVVTALPAFAQVSEPATARWNCTRATPESASLAAETNVTVPRRFAPGSFIGATGPTSSTRNESRCASQWDEVTVLALAPVEPAAACVLLSSATLARSVAVAEADCESTRSLMPLAVENVVPVAEEKAASSSEPAACVVIAGAAALVEVPFAAAAEKVSTTEVVFIP